jgi:hypothetical protein
MPSRCHLRYDYAQHGHKIFTFDQGAKSVFEVLANAMAISHYAVAFFCAQRNRVTLEGQRVLFSKAPRMISAMGLEGFLSGNILSAAKQPQVKI